MQERDAVLTCTECVRMPRRHLVVPRHARATAPAAYYRLLVVHVVRAAACGQDDDGASSISCFALPPLKGLHPHLCPKLLTEC